jgi:hypothetical protein
MTATIFTYARTFSEVRYAEAFIGGHVRMPSLNYYRSLEDGNDPLRGDAYEGTSAVLRIKKVSIAGREFAVSSASGRGRLAFTETLSWCASCLTAIGITEQDGDDLKSAAQLKRAMQLDDRCSQLGQNLVYFTNPDEFIRRFYAATDKLGLRSKARLVNHFDESSFHGSFPSSDIAFMKPRRFAYQKEFRLVVATPEGTPAPFILDLGPLHDVAELTTVADFRQSLTVTAKDGSKA